MMTIDLVRDSQVKLYNTYIIGKSKYTKAGT